MRSLTQERNNGERRVRRQLGTGHQSSCNLRMPVPKPSTETSWTGVGIRFGKRLKHSAESTNLTLANCHVTLAVAVEWWLAVASAGNPSIHLPQSKPWTPPRWLAGDGKEKASLLKNHTRLLGLRLDQVITEELALAEIQRVSIRRSEQSSARRAHKKQSNVVRRRAGVVFGAIQAGLVGLHYCRYLDKNRVIPLPAWVSEGCPKTYVAAYTEGKPWRKKIQDEKHRFTLKFESTAPQQREQLIQAATRSTRL
jgi:hypothetical protein